MKNLLRLYISIAVIVAFFSYDIVYFSSIFYELSPRIGDTVNSALRLFGVIFGLFSLFVGVSRFGPEFLFLQSFSTSSIRLEEKEGSFRETEREIRKQLEKIEAQTRRYRDEARVASQQSQPAEFEKIRLDILNSIGIDEIRNAVGSEIEKIKSNDYVVEEFTRIRDNLVDYRRSNRSQYTLNLGIGILLGASALLVAGYLLLDGDSRSFLNNDGEINVGKLITFYVPWITIIIVIEFLAMFFLRLYRENIQTERYLRDEITSIGNKIAGCHLAIAFDDGPTIKKVIDELVKSDRHQILAKGQTSVEVEKARLDKENFKDSLDFMSTMMPWDTAKKAIARKPKSTNAKQHRAKNAG